MSAPDFRSSPEEFQPIQPAGDALPPLEPLVEEVPITAPALPAPLDRDPWEWAGEAEQPPITEAATRDPYADCLYPALEPTEYIPVDQPLAENILAAVSRLGPYLATNPEAYPPNAAQLLPGRFREVPVGDGESVRIDTKVLSQGGEEPADAEPTLESVGPKSVPRDPQHLAGRIPGGWLVARNNYVTTSGGGLSEQVGAIVLLSDGRLAAVEDFRSYDAAVGLSGFDEDPFMTPLTAEKIDRSTWLAEMGQAVRERSGLTFRQQSSMLFGGPALAANLNAFIDRLGLPDAVLDELFPDRPRPT